MRSLFEKVKNLIIEIRAGEGGEDSKSFVDELATVYLSYANKKNLKTNILNAKSGHISIEISGENVWNIFKHEAGKHQVQRIPPNERNDRTHTSVVVVGIIKLFDFKEKTLNMSEVEVQTQRGSGPGGQHRNKTDSAVRMRHKPTGITVFIDGRDQSQNKRKAFEILSMRVNTHYYEQARSAYSAEKKDQIGNGDRTGRIRTYNFKNNFIYDHRTGIKTSNVKEIMKGRLDLLYK